MSVLRTKIVAPQSLMIGSRLVLVPGFGGLLLLMAFAGFDGIQALQQIQASAISKMLVEDSVRQMQERKVKDSYDLLTTREREILQLLAEGKNNKEAAGILNLSLLSLYTVETHRSNIFQKLNLHSGAELVLYAIRKGVIS